MDLTERQLSRETIYEGKILHIYRDDVLLPNGRTSVREVAEHPGGVVQLRVIARRVQNG